MSNPFTGPKLPSFRASSLLERRVGRRSLLAGLGAAVVAAAAGGARWLNGREGSAGAPQESATAQAPVAASTPSPATPVPQTTSLRTAATVLQQASVPDGMALVTSPRLPLFGVGSAQRGALLGGEISDWREAGSAVSTEVEPLALDGQTPPGMTPAATFADYEALVAGLAEHRGGLAIIPLEQVDFRVNVLAVDGVDPLRDQDNADEPVIRVGVVGDIVPGRNVHIRMATYGDFSRPFYKVAAELSSYDLTIANLEGNISDTLAQPDNPNTFDFVSSPAMIDGFKLAGIDAVSLANNHTAWNSAGWGLTGLLDTMAALDAAAFPFFGAGHSLDQARAPWVSTVKGRTIAFLGIDGVTANVDAEGPGIVARDYGAGPDTPGTSPYVIDYVLSDIAAAAAQYDIVIPYFHLGAEYVGVPPQWAVEGCHAAIDAGATMVVTNHPHVIQGMEIYAGKPIVYSVGNFIFDQMFSVDTRQGLILEITLRGNRVAGIRTRGVEIVDFHQPRLMSTAEQAAIMDRFWRSTERIAGA